MTCAEMVDDVEAEIRYAFLAAQVELPGTEEIVRVLNKYNDRISGDLRVPRKYVTDIDPTVAITMPTDARAGSVRFTEKEEAVGSIQVLTVDEANMLYPDWEDNEHEGGSTFPYKLVIYDPSNLTDPLYAIGFTSSDKLRMVYTVQVKPMVLENSAADADVSLLPFNGLMPEYHHVIAQMTKFEFLLRIGDERGRAYYTDAQDEIAKAFAYANNHYVVPEANYLGIY